MGSRGFHTKGCKLSLVTCTICQHYSARMISSREPPLCFESSRCAR